MGAEDYEIGLAMARKAGALWAGSDVVDLLEMPMLAAFLEERGELLQEVTVDVMLHVASTRPLSQVLVAESEATADLGAEEVAEGIARMAASEAMAEGSAELADAGMDLVARGIEELAIAQAAAGTPRDLAADGVAEAVVGGAELGAAAVMAGGAEAAADEKEEQE